ncbi:MAG: SPOR domain-containing protein [Tenuifilaceae bacterium]|jgi:nucleoid DNA-binding protein|nr:SPOR domain-containing protein [Tenuifilaceae bacterium]
MDTQFLRELIEKNARVILPDFGAFLVKDDGTGVFKPSNVTFSPFLRYNDGMVEDSLAASRKIGKDQAKEELTKFIDSIRDKLQTKKAFVVEGLGSLIVDNRGSIQFTTETTPAVKPTEEKVEKPTPPKVVTPVIDDSTQEKGEERKPKEEKSEPKPIEVKPEEKPKVIPEKEEIKKKPESIELPKSEVEKPKGNISKPVAKKTFTPPPATPKKAAPTSSSTGTGKAILYGTLIGVGFVTIMASIWYLYSQGAFSSGKNQKTATAITASKTQNIPAAQPADSERGKFEDEFKKLSQEMDETTPAEETSQTKNTTDKRIAQTKPADNTKVSIAYPQEGMFHLIVGSFRNANYAEKYSKDMKASGYNSKVIVQPTGMHAVSLGSFLTREQAVDSMNQWKLKYPNIWILKQ